MHRESHQNRGNGKTQEKHKPYLVSNKICLTRMSSQCIWEENEEKGSPTVRLAVPCANGTTHVYAGARFGARLILDLKNPQNQERTGTTITQHAIRSKDPDRMLKISSRRSTTHGHTRKLWGFRAMAVYFRTENERARALILAPPTVPSNRNAWLATFVQSLNTSRETAATVALSSSLTIHRRIW